MVAVEHSGNRIELAAVAAVEMAPVVAAGIAVQLTVGTVAEVVVFVAEVGSSESYRMGSSIQIVIATEIGLVTVVLAFVG